MDKFKRVLWSFEMKEEYFMSHSYANFTPGIWYIIKEKIFIGESISEVITELKKFNFYACYDASGTLIYTKNTSIFYYWRKHIKICVAFVT